MIYQALYRQWRPLKFADVVGQEHITRTLSNAIAQGNITHAYLFSGPHGVGKTSTARIMSRAINCLSSDTSDPCNKCAICRSIIEGRALDIIEIDAASNNGVDEIRDLRERVKFSPAECRYKVYIIDEVHMLSTAAFNALLKTLEEPPSHVVFILATTELHKIPATIKSRCQRFDFQRINLEQIVGQLKKIAEVGNVQVEDAVYPVIARAADGSLRDAISIFDQCLAYSEETISLGQVQELLGTIDDQVLYSVTNYIMHNQVAPIMQTVAQVYQKGRSMEQFLADYLHYLRGLLQLQGGIQNSGIILEDETMAFEQARALGNERLFMMVHAIVAAANEIKYAPNQRLVVELALLECQYVTGTDLQQLGARISILEQRIVDLQANPSELVTPIEIAPVVVKAEKPSAEIEQVSVAIVPAMPKQPIAEFDNYGDSLLEPEVIFEEPEAIFEAPIIRAKSAPIKTAKEIQAKIIEEIPVSIVEEVEAEQVVVAQPGIDPTLTINQINRQWDDILKRVKELDTITAAFLKVCKPFRYQDGKLTVKSAESFHADMLCKPEKKDIVEQAIKEVLIVPIRFECIVDTVKSDSKTQKAEKKIDMVQRTLDIFKGKIIDDPRSGGNLNA